MPICISMNKKTEKNDIELLVDDMKKRGLLPTEEDTIIHLENVLDYYCKIADRDIFIIPPIKKDKHILYLMEEIMKTVKLICKQIIVGGKNPIVDGIDFPKFHKTTYNEVKSEYVN